MVAAAAKAKPPLPAAAKAFLAIKPHERTMPTEERGKLRLEAKGGKNGYRFGADFRINQKTTLSYTQSL